MGTTSSQEAPQATSCGLAWLCTPQNSPHTTGDEDEFHNLEVHAKVKRRGQNVFAESVDISDLPEQKVTPAMKKSKTTRNVIRLTNPRCWR